MFEDQVVLNALMEREREIFLRRAGPDNKGNGFYPRVLSSGLGPIELTVPRDRLAQFRPFLLPESWQRGDQSMDDLMAVQVLVDKLHRDRWKKPMPAMLEYQYEIHQMFRQRFP